MSPAMDNFVHSLVEMARSQEQLPIIERELADAKAQLEAASAAIQAREEAIVRYKDEINNLQSKNRELEVARDDAEYRFLELDDKAHKVLAQVAAISATADAVKAQLDPPKPQPEPVVEPANADWEHQTDDVGQPMPVSVPTPPTQAQVDPIGSGSTGGIVSTEATPSPTVSGDASVPSVGSGQGQSEPPFPLPSHTTTPEPTSYSVGTPKDVGQEQSSPAIESPSEPQPWVGLKYSNVPHYVSLRDWLAGGGSEPDYYAR